MNSLKMNAFLSFIGVTEMLSVGLSNQCNSLLWTDFSYLYWLKSYCRKPRKFIHHVQMWQLVNHDIYQKSVYKIEFYRSANHVDQLSAFSALRKRKHSFQVSTCFVVCVMKWWSLLPNILSRTIASHDLETLISELVLKRAFTKYILLPSPFCGFWTAVYWSKMCRETVKFQNLSCAPP